MSVEKFKERLKLFDDNDEIIDNIFRCQMEQYASPYWLKEAIENLAGLHDLAEEMIKHMERQDDQEA